MAKRGSGGTDAGGDVEVVFNHFPRLAGQLGVDMAEAVNNGMANFIAATADRIPWATGNMAGDIAVEAATAAAPTATLEYLAEYAIHVHEGHAVHPGGPRDDGVLADERNPASRDQDGNVVGRPWTRETMDIIHDDLVADLNDAVRRWAATNTR